jgi:hypothetical protein
MIPDPRHSAAVLIGSGRFDDPGLSGLDCVATNVATLGDLLAGTDLWGLPPENCVRVVDPQDSAAMLDPVYRLSRQATDTLLVYYSGHGLVAPNGELVLTPASTRPDLLPATGVPYAHLRDIVDRSRADRRIVILDCCFSGRAVHAMTDVASTVMGQIDVEGTYVLTSSPATSTSSDNDGQGHTAFTGGLVRILHEGIPGAGPRLSLEEIYYRAIEAMARGRWPQPQKRGTNTIGELRFLRNAAWRANGPPAAATTFTDPARQRRMATGVRDAVAVVAETLGRPDRDGLHELRTRLPVTRSGPGEAEPERRGVELVRETMLTMRQQYGDGAATAAVILGGLVDGITNRVGTGGSAALDTLGVEAQHLVAILRADPAPIDVTDEALSAAVRSAVGMGDPVSQVVAAVRAVGPGNVEVVAATAPTGPAIRSTFSLETRTLAPNATTSPISLRDPLVIVSVDGELDTWLRRRPRGPRRGAVLIVAPRLGIPTMRALVHAFTEIVVVAPSQPRLDLRALAARFGHRDGERAGWDHAVSALIVPGLTTIKGVAEELTLSRNRIEVRIGAPDTDGRMAVAARALSAARAATAEGVVYHGLAQLSRAAAAYDPSSAADPSIGFILRAAVSEPHRRARLVLPVDRQTGPHDATALATLRGSVLHATAAIGEFLAPA